MFIADTGPLLCHGTLPKGPQRFRSAISGFAHVPAVRAELEDHARRRDGASRHLSAAARPWVGRHIDRLGKEHDLSNSQSAIARVHGTLKAWDAERGKADRRPDANAGEAEAIVAATELGACLVANDDGARAVANKEGIADVWTTVDILVAEIDAGAVTDATAFDDYQLMKRRNTDPGEALRGPLDFTRRRRAR